MKKLHEVIEEIEQLEARLLVLKESRKKLTVERDFEFIRRALAGESREEISLSTGFSVKVVNAAISRRCLESGIQNGLRRISKQCPT